MITPIPPGAKRRVAGTPPSVLDLRVLTQLARGQTNKQIGGDLDISPETVKSHVTRLQVKLGARNRAHVVAEAIRDGFLLEAVVMVDRGELR